MNLRRTNLKLSSSLRKLIRIEVPVPKHFEVSESHFSLAITKALNVPAKLSHTSLTERVRISTTQRAHLEQHIIRSKLSVSVQTNYSMHTKGQKGKGRGGRYAIIKKLKTGKCVASKGLIKVSLRVSDVDD
eukprot:TRINITY_DN8423_c0_g1_i3.p1 TRINITY_DN8423_c0_g1~~TRINITY_DN8423_c0_g1_i3.p1  ORF type:complete len:131 (-),score=2.88 TRINITY_DN8423_c0_g1_i3:308-700(-)